MKRSIFIAAMLGALSLHGQAYNNGVFQTLGNLSGVRTLDEGFGNRVVTGKPFSATEERHSLQVLGDGTRIENSEMNRLYRDSEGRTRVEEMNGIIAIYDPVAKLRVELDPSTKIARKSNGANSFSYVTGVSTSFGATFGSPVLTQQNPQVNAASLKGVMAETTENLGSQSVNGVTAQGIRTTMTIPKGQIGNNKDIKVMTERWSSTDLQMLVKSVNNDPRFGDTTYQLTKVVQSAPDPALFQIPADYTVTDQTAPGLRLPVAARGGGRAGAPGRAAQPALAPLPPLPAPAVK